jgi:cation:H+ antiporter
LDLWLAILAFIFGMALLYFSSEKTVDKLINIAKIFGASMFSIGFIVSSVGSDLPEIVNGVISGYLGHGDISVGNSLGSVNAQISLVLGLIPFFCTFCRLIPRSFLIVGATEVVALIIAVFLSLDGALTRIDGAFLVLLWGVSIFILRRFGEEKIAVEESEELEVTEDRISKLVPHILLGFIGIAIGSYLVIESVIAISKIFGISEFIISFFILSIGTSLPELVVSISAIRKRYFELAVGDIIGSCLVDVTLALGIGPMLFPITVDGRAVLISGVIAGFVSIVVVGVLGYRQFNDKKSGALFLLVYLSTWIIATIL